MRYIMISMLLFLFPTNILAGEFSEAEALSFCEANADQKYKSEDPVRLFWDDIVICMASKKYLYNLVRCTPMYDERLNAYILTGAPVLGCYIKIGN